MALKIAASENYCKKKILQDYLHQKYDEKSSVHPAGIQTVSFIKNRCTSSHLSAFLINHVFFSQTTFKKWIYLKSNT